MRWLDASSEPMADLAGADSCAAEPPARAGPMRWPGRFHAAAVGAAANALIRLAYRAGRAGARCCARRSASRRGCACWPRFEPAAGRPRGGHGAARGAFPGPWRKSPIGADSISPAARLTPPFERVVHGFAWLRDLAASAPREQCAPVAERHTAPLAAWRNPRAGRRARPGRIEHAGRAPARTGWSMRR